MQRYSGRLWRGVDESEFLFGHGAFPRHWNAGGPDGRKDRQQGGAKATL